MIKIGQASFQGVEQLRQALERAGAMFPTLWKKALDDAADIAQKFLGRQFATAGREFGAAWSPLAKSTQADRKRKGYKPSRPILVRRGWLRASVIEKRSANHQRTVTLHGVTLASSLKTKSGLNLLMLHQAGTAKMPARKIFKEGQPPFISQRGWEEIKIRFMGAFVELRREMVKQ